MSRFVRIQDTVNERISIHVDTETRCVNATKTLNQFYELYPLEEGQSRKKVAGWTRSKAVKQFIDLVKEKCQIEEPIYDLLAGFANEDRGTYMCSIVYDEFLMWLSSSYKIDLLKLIEKTREEKVVQATKERDDALKERDSALEARDAAVEEKDTAIKEKSKAEKVLTNIERMMAQAIRDGAERELAAEEREKAATKRAEDAMNIAKETKFDLARIEKTLTSEIKYVAGMLKEKSIQSTMNPPNEKLVHNYVCMGHDFVAEDGKKGVSLYHIAGQNDYVRTAMRKKYDDEEHQWKEVIAMNYSANPIDLRNNIKVELGKYKAAVVKEVNEARVREASIHNERLKKEINAFNKLNPDNKRMFRNEKKVAKKISPADIPIRATKLTSTYIENEFISYDQYLDVIRGVDIKTKKSPYQTAPSVVKEE